jgi:tetratricopeptide (TPR) repeat protein
MSRRIFFTLLPVLSAWTMVSCRQSPQDYVAKGNTFFDAGKYQDAILNYKKAIQKDSKFGEGYYRLGLAELKTDQVREAYEALSNANAFLPDRADVKITFGDFVMLAYLSNKNRPVFLYTQLVKLSDNLITKDPSSYDGLRYKGALAWADGRLKEAEELFQKANTRKPLEPGLILMWVQVMFQNGQSEDAIRLAMQLIQAHKDAGQIYDVLYNYYRSQNRVADAEGTLRTKVNNNPSDINGMVQLAMFYAANGKRDQMTAILQRVAEDSKTFPDGRLKVGDFYGAMQDWPEALRQYQEGAKANPKEKVTYSKRIADTWLAQGKGEQAAGTVSEILKERPNDDAAKAVNASLLLKTGNPEKIKSAVNDLRELVKKEPDNPLYKFALGQALLVKGDRNEATAQFRESLNKNPRYLPSIMALSQLSLSKRDYAPALEYANSALAVNPRLVEARLVRSAALLATQRYSDAGSALKALEIDLPQSIEVQFQLVGLDLADRKFPQAETRLEQLYRKDPYRALAGLVEAYKMQGQIDKALSRLNMELGKSSNPAAIRLLLAETAIRASKYDVALNQYQQLQVMFPRSAQLETRLGTVYQLQGNSSKAIASFERAKELAPRDPVVAAALGDALAVAGRNDDAVASYRQMLALDPENANAMNNLAYALLVTGGAPDEAQKLAERALQKSPRNPSFADTLGMVYLKKNLLDSAIHVYGGLTQRFPENPSFRYHYALSLTQTGQRERAKTEFEAALRKSPSAELRKNIEASLAKVQQ